MVDHKHESKLIYKNISRVSQSQHVNPPDLSFQIISLYIVYPAQANAEWITNKVMMFINRGIDITQITICTHLIKLGWLLESIITWMILYFSYLTLKSRNVEQYTNSLKRWWCYSCHKHIPVTKFHLAKPSELQRCLCEEAVISYVIKTIQLLR